MNRSDAHLLRSQLFVPALSDQFVEKAASRGADAIIVDLEDSIAPAEKERAREHLAGVVTRIAAGGLPVFVRVNNEPMHLAADLESLARAPLAGIYLPKVERAQQVVEVSAALAALERRLGQSQAAIALVLLLESPLAVHAAAQLAVADGRVISLIFGSEDYATSMGVQPTLEAMRFPSQLVALAARAHGLAAWGVAGSVAEFSDLPLFRSMAVAARDAGYTGACAIHPRQVAVLNEVFGANEAEVTEAQEIVAAFDEALRRGAGAVAYKGRMLDIPVVDRARQLLAKSRLR
jgi:citrate lyase subunit beta/citryl-CoA lyase